MATMAYSSIAVSLLVVTASMNCSVDGPAFKITTKRSDDRVTAKSEAGQALFIVRSPMGISHAFIERSRGDWPDKVVIQLQLNGLESFRLSTANLKLNASVSSQSGDVRLWQDGNDELLLDSKSPYWIEIRILGGGGKPTRAIPLKDGCFEIHLPKKFFEGNPQSFKLEWIDFHRS
jgi:hypothetical protein